MNWLDIEIFTCNMNKFHIYIYIYSPAICMNRLDIYIYIYSSAICMNCLDIYIFTREIHELPRYIYVVAYHMNELHMDI